MLESIFAFTRRIAPTTLRITLAVILAWIGALKFADPRPVRGLVEAGLPFLASDTFVYAVGVLELVAAALLVANVAVRYVGFGVMVLFLGTLTIFFVAPTVTYGDAGFPYLTLAGQFLLKDLVLLAATVTLVANDSARYAHMAEPMMMPMAPRDRAEKRVA